VAFPLLFVIFCRTLSRSQYLVLQQRAAAPASSDRETRVGTSFNVLEVRITHTLPNEQTEAEYSRHSCTAGTP